MQHQDIANLHGEQDVARNNARIKRIAILFGILSAIAVAVIVASLIWRDASHMNNPNEVPSQIITIAVTVVCGALIIFLWGMKLSPLLAYRKFLKEIGRGLSRYVEGIVVRVDEDTSFRDGLPFYAMIINIGTTEDPEDERLLYWDAKLGKPEAITPGEHILFHAHGNDILGFEKK